MKNKRNNYLKQGIGRVRFIDLLLPLRQVMKRVHLYMCKKNISIQLYKENYLSYNNMI
jgi:hypothetical protein